MPSVGCPSRAGAQSWTLSNAGLTPGTLWGQTRGAASLSLRIRVTSPGRWLPR